MAGMYGEIDSRRDFERILVTALATIKHLRRNAASDEMLESVEAQLEAMQRWTLNGRTPTNDERESIDVGLLAARGLENTGDPAMDVFAQQLQWLNNYFEDWPSDDDAASSTEEDFFEADA
jgi:hypothetical protein